jgi:Mg-chelatase subunit ChlD
VRQAGTFLAAAVLILSAAAGMPKAQAETVPGQAAPASWSDPAERVVDGPEGDVVIRVGDIDNVGVGFEPGYDPFSGANTEPHEWPRKPEADDPPATDRMLIGSHLAKNYDQAGGGDGYHQSVELPSGVVPPIVIPVAPLTTPVRQALVQIFIDDFQSPSFQSRWQATLDGQPLPLWDRVFAHIDQSGPIGKLVSLRVPEAMLPKLAQAPSVSLLIDDSTTVAGDGISIDFVRLMINPIIINPVDVVITVISAETYDPIPNAMVQSALAEGLTDADGRLTLKGIPAGLVVALADASGFEPGTGSVDVAVRTVGEIEIRLQPIKPGSIVVQADEAELAAGAKVHAIFDVSGSMLQRIGGRRKIEIAREALASLVESDLPPGTEFGVRVLGVGGSGSCATELVVPVGPPDRAAVLAAVLGIEAVNGAKTPLGAALEAARDDLGLAQAAPATRGATQVVLLTDGEETCDGDAGKAIAALRAAGASLRVDIVGFDIRDPALQAQFAAWAEAGGGAYFDARDAGGLSDALRDALRVRWQLRTEGGDIVGNGYVNGEPVPVPAGRYRLAIGSGKERDVEVGNGQAVVLNYEPAASSQP